MPKSDLSMLQPGESGIVESLNESGLRTKLAEMGIFKGRVIKVLFKAPFGDPIAVEVGGYVLSLRKDEARIVALRTSI